MMHTQVKEGFTSRTLRCVLAAALAASCFVASAGLAFAQSIDDPLSEEELALAEGGSSASARSLDDFWRWPLPGIGEDHISQDFWSGHGAIDIWAAEGTPIVAARGGIVVATEATNPQELDGYGNCVVVYHEDGTESYYAHMSRRDVNKGDRVYLGQQLGLVGNTGNSFGDHLHFEIRVNATPDEFYWGERIDPLPYVAGHDYDVSQNGVWFSDVDFGANAQWYAPWVEQAVLSGLMEGAGDNLFQPDSRITRGQVLTILCRAAGADGAYGNGVNDTPFDDNLPGQYYTGAINWAYNVGVAEGNGDAVSPDDLVTREELATLIARYAEKVRGVHSTAPASELAGMDDADEVSSWAVGHVAWAIQADIITGSAEADGSLLVKSSGNASRAEMAAIIVRTVDAVG